MKGGGAGQGQADVDGDVDVWRICSVEAFNKVSNIYSYNIDEAPWNSVHRGYMTILQASKQQWQSPDVES